MTIQNGQTANADDVMNAFGSVINDSMQNLFNADYLGFDSRLFNSGSPNLKNTFYSTFTSDDADETNNIEYDATNDLYQTINPSSLYGSYYVIINADDASISWTNNNTQLDKLSSGEWILYGTSGTDEVKRANIHKSLWYGTDGTNQLVLDFSNITALKTTSSKDVGKTGYFAKVISTIIYNTGGSQGNHQAYFDITFNDTTDNTDSSFWSKVFMDQNFSGATSSSTAFFPSATTVNNVSVNNSAATSDELGTDTTADEYDNPANAKVQINPYIPLVSAGVEGSSEAIFLAYGSVSFSQTDDITPYITNGSVSFSNIDFNVDYSIPAFTSLNPVTQFGEGYLIFKDTTSESVTNAIPIINYNIDATSSITIEISADGGSNWTEVNNVGTARPTTGTSLWRRVTISRTDVSKQDKVTEQAVKYNLY